MSSIAVPSPHSSPTCPDVATAMLPPLPEIQSEQIRKRIFTHSSLAVSHRYDFQAPESDPSADNEEFGHIGDQVFGLVITDLIQGLYPHLRVGPASKVRDQIKRKCVLAEICVSYELHRKLNLPERQANRLRTSQSVQVNVFKAYVGGLYRDQGLKVVTEWLTSLFQSRVEAAYQNVRKEHLLAHATTAAEQPRAPGTTSPSPSSSTSEGVVPALLSHPARDPVTPAEAFNCRPMYPNRDRGRPTVTVMLILR
ncbi:ribonuclease III domain-containing protein [Russula compacta]|nr:ribonuclease III domain-containing protein [Russula compacta]